jgi:hypothetical protein
MEGCEGVDHAEHSNNSEDSGANDSHAVAEVEQAHGQTTENHGEVQPAEEGTLVGEEDFGLDASRERNALACGRDM